jgi:hypothetical protein
MLRDNSLLVLATVVLIAVAIAVITRARRIVHDAEAKHEEDLLTDLQKAYIKGQMDDTEFQRIRQSLERKQSADGVVQPGKATPLPATEGPISKGEPVESNPKASEETAAPGDAPSGPEGEPV